MPFDPESGQIYDESFTALPRKDEDDMVYVDKPGHVRERPKNRCSTKGTRTLHHMAMLSIMRSLDMLYPDLLKAYPLPLLEQIWKAINMSDLAGLRMWKLFAPAHVTDRRVVKRPQSIFSHAIDQGSSIDCTWLTDLTLDAIPLSIAEYIHVSSMPNLASLAVVSRSIQEDTGFSDRILRAWDSDAKTGSFSKLQHIFVSGHRNITEQSLAYLGGFNALDMFCAHNCQFFLPFRASEKDTDSSELAFQWHDHPFGKFRAFLRIKSIAHNRRDDEAPFPSSFHAYVAHCRRTRDSSLSKTPHLHLRLLSDSTQKEGVIHSRHATLHCLERRNCDPRAQTARESHLTPKNKRRKLKGGKARDLGDMLAGLT